MKSPPLPRAPRNVTVPNPRRRRRWNAVKNRCKRLWRRTKVRARKVRSEVKFMRYLLQRLKALNDWCRRYCKCCKKPKKSEKDEWRTKEEKEGEGRGAWILRGIKKAFGMVGGGLQTIGQWGMKGLKRIFGR